ncbi:hypothetical protein WJX72_010997 [[Myrmecia] bisecta]|uniref:TAFII55 protein conserved region domain-containing protein n=1 Tax=[Myrmecia] bisecta TaxID=41462 RepID=A0AAW1QB54_9CHLO
MASLDKSNHPEKEEQFVLRVQDRSVADRIRRVLRQDAAADPKDAKMELKFELANPRCGKFTIGEDSLPVALLDLPGVVESYKTYDDINLVKSTDIGQMLLVQEKGAAPMTEPEAKNGVTPPMRDARRRNFRKHIDVDPELVRRVEQDILTIAAGGAPAGVEYEDVEEEFVVDEHGHGSWQPYKRGN